jgi:hypothetical protein
VSFQLVPPLTHREIARRLNRLRDGEQWRCRCPWDASHELIVAKRNSLLVFEPHEPCELGPLIAKLRTAGLMRTVP